MSNELKNKLDQEPLEFDTSMAWEQLSPKLDSSKRKRQGIIWWWLGGSAGVIALAFAAFFAYSSASVENAEFVKSENVVLNETAVLPKGTAKTNTAGTGNSEISTSDSRPVAETSIFGENKNPDVKGTSKKGASLPLAEVNGAKSSNYSTEKRGATESPRDESSTSVVEQFGTSKVSTDATQFETVGSSLLERLAEAESVAGDEGSPVVEGELDSGLFFEKDQASVFQEKSNLQELDLLGLPFLEIQDDEKLGPISVVKSGSIIPYGKLSTKPYWQVGVLAGVGYERVTSDGFEFLERTELEVRNLQLNVTRSFSKRFAVTAHAQLGRRMELYRTDFTRDIEENVYNPAALIAGGERFGDSVTVISEQRLRSDRYATFTRLNVGATVEYLIPTRICDYAVYGGINYALLQRWSGSRMIQPEPNAAVVEDLNGPYDLTAYPSRFSYVLGARISKPIGKQLQFIFDSRVLLASQYRIASDNAFSMTERGNSVTVSLGLGWRF